MCRSRADGDPHVVVLPLLRAVKLPNQFNVQLLHCHLIQHIFVQIVKLVFRISLLAIDHFFDVLERVTVGFYRKKYLFWVSLPLIESIDFVQCNDEGGFVLLQQLDRLSGLILQTVHNIDD